MRMRMLVVGVLLTVLCWDRPAAAAGLCLYPDPVTPGSGKSMKWPSSAMPIKYLVNASEAAPADKDAFITAVKAAFAAYEAVTCSELKFTYGGESVSVSSDALNAILVVFKGKDTGGSGAYYYLTNSKPPDATLISDALIQMNVKDFKYVVGKQTNAIDVQTAVTQMIPGALGFYVGTDPASGSLDEIKFNYQNTTVSDEQKKGVQFLYFKAGTGCTQPAAPAMCPPKGQAGDGQKASDGGVKGDGTKPAIVDGRIGAGDGKTGGDASLPPPADDDGCCRVSHARSGAGQGLLALVGLGLLLALRRRRR